MVYKFEENIPKDLDGFFKQEGDFKPENLDLVERILTRERVMETLDSILNEEAALSAIAKRSYIHSQGFRKIILHKTKKYALRFHFWPEGFQEEGAPVGEMKHEHKWNFVSRFMLGEAEDHHYLIQELNPTELSIYEKFEAVMQTLPIQKVLEICDRLDALENSQISPESKVVKLNGGIDEILKKANVADLCAQLNLSEVELNLLTRILAKYSNQRLESGEELYKPAGPRVFTPIDVLNHRAGEFRMHPIDIAHRLVIDPQTYSATAVVTGPNHKNRKPGEFVRSKAGKKDEDVRERVYFTAETLSEAFQDVMKRINL